MCVCVSVTINEGYLLMIINIWCNFVYLNTPGLKPEYTLIINNIKETVPWIYAIIYINL